MRLKGIGHYSKATDNADLYVELAQLAVLVGPNDSGKTRTLFAVDEALRRHGPWLGDLDAPSPTPGHDFHFGVFVELDDDELFAACNACLDALLADADLDPSAWGLFSFRELQDYDPAWIDAGSQLQGPGAVQTWFELVRRSWSLTDDRFDTVFSALAESRLAQVTEGVGGSLNLSLALSPDIANSNGIADLLDEIGYEEGHPAPTRSCPSRSRPAATCRGHSGCPHPPARRWSESFSTRSPACFRAARRPTTSPTGFPRGRSRLTEIRLTRRSRRTSCAG